IDAIYRAGLVYNINDYWRCHSSDYFSLDKDVQASVIEETRAMLSLPEPPTAIYYTHTRLSIYGHIFLRQTLKEMGLEVPRDLSLAFNSAGYEEEAGLSGFSADPTILAKHLIEGIYASIDNPFHPHQVLLPVPFVDRGSIAQAPTSSK